MGAVIPLSLTACLEETAEQRRGAAFLYAADDLGPVVAGGLLKDAGTVLDPAALGVGRAEIEPPQPGKGDCLGVTWHRVPA